jgi:hypothetical protein
MLPSGFENAIISYPKSRVIGGSEINIPELALLSAIFQRRMHADSVIPSPASRPLQKLCMTASSDVNISIFTKFC